MRGSWCKSLAVVALFLLPLSAGAESLTGGEVLHAAPLGPIVDAPDGRSEMEIVQFDERLTASLRSLAPEQTLRVDDWPVSPGHRAQVVLRRFDVYAPDAKIVVIEDGVERELPRSSRIFLQGAVEGGPETGSRVLSWLDPETGVFGGFAVTSRGTFVLAALGASERFGSLAAVRFPYSTGLTVLVTTPVWIAVTLLTKPVSREHLIRFYRRCHPGGPGWREVSRALPGVPAAGPGLSAALRIACGVAALYLVLFGIGALVLGRYGNGALLLSFGAAALAALAVLLRRSDAAPRPPQ